MFRSFLFISALLLSTLSQSLWAASTMRCNSHLISLGEKQHSVLSKCGQPAEQSFLGYKEVVNAYRHVHEVKVEEWVYGPRNGMYHYLRFEGGALIKISSSR